jgi:hypothetical protein
MPVRRSHARRVFGRDTGWRGVGRRVHPEFELRTKRHPPISESVHHSVSGNRDAESFAPISPQQRPQSRSLSNAPCESGTGLHDRALASPTTTCAYSATPAAIATGAFAHHSAHMSSSPRNVAPHSYRVPGPFRLMDFVPTHHFLRTQTMALPARSRSRAKDPQSPGTPDDRARGPGKFDWPSAGIRSAAALASTPAPSPGPAARA